ncbi:hypothetical protein GCM10008983_05490 [Lentibacillus halophilus]|uniref:Plasmid pRiA4b Orf3-like domain-containing protein n=1 Tax=Lentibacillus halophilus TaxID=295065 RepID=A0ABN0Z457_9BACI
MDRPDGKPLQIVMEDVADTLDLFDFESYEMGRDRFTLLEDVFPMTGQIHYEYDLGDSWGHVITLEKTVTSQALRPYYLEGAGFRPPEDVGGEGGFEAYLRIMADENDPDHTHMTTWSDSQKERDLSMEQINERLQRVFMGYMYSPYFV